MNRSRMEIERTVAACGAEVEECEFDDVLEDVSERQVMQHRVVGPIHGSSASVSVFRRRDVHGAQITYRKW